MVIDGHCVCVRIAMCVRHVKLKSLSESPVSFVCTFTLQLRHYHLVCCLPSCACAFVRIGLRVSHVKLKFLSESPVSFMCTSPSKLLAVLSRLVCCLCRCPQTVEVT